MMLFQTQNAALSGDRTPLHRKHPPIVHILVENRIIIAEFAKKNKFQYFISVSEHSSDQCQSQLRCDVNKMVCSRPFCKLKKKQLHFHCSVCDQGFSDRIKFQMHATKHRNSSNNSSHHVQTMRKYNLGKRSEECSTASKLPVIMTDVSNKWTTRSDEDSLPLDLSVKKASPSDPPKSFSGELESVGLSNGEELPFTLRRIRFSL
ncbi:hypothetical protein RB195_017126 [Necator americanus]|uniref:C2H2-type domain-containing protein n=1 Tax=Necator americanus TaxID=51031 RepID=A0ABR1C5Y0_NECAM